MVYWHHHQLAAHESSRVILESGFGFRGQRYFVTLPGIRLLFTGGHFAVATFFVISGYALFIKPLRLMERGDMSGLTDCLSSAVFRRWFRLYLPFAGAALVYVVVSRGLGRPGPGIKPQLGWWGELGVFFNEFANYSFVFDQTSCSSPWFSYNTHLWSIPGGIQGLHDGLRGATGTGAKLEEVASRL